MDWDALRVFLAVAKSGSLTRAAQTLGLSQPTVGRRLASLEADTGARLLERTPRGYVATEAGAAILANIERMEGEALAVERAITGRDAGLSGAIRVTAIEWFAARVLAPIVAEFSLEHPAVTVELLTDVRLFSLTRREADIAVSFAPFDQREIFQRKAADVPHGLFASPVYLDRRGAPDCRTGMAGHALIQMDDAHWGQADAAWLARLAPDARIALRSNSREAQAQACLAGAGIAILPQCLGRKTPGLVEIPTVEPAPMRTAWIGVHRDVRRIPRIRLDRVHRPAPARVGVPQRIPRRGRRGAFRRA
ncbi:LysR family transcriptional regulator [Phenylobacterium deserti]|uniref:LysR family transcriptional regulator n=1 Tax=Phenylobacterium deserti TaxID=1914756 RepID=A0A328ADU8_9CAUL|nr:LysR family transcriptional regulator [Phenylobacterium deserti]RAK53013.1 LysR family transcriptional regulator [Phenylobacterium deserti]